MVRDEISCFLCGKLWSNTYILIDILGGPDESACRNSCELLYHDELIDHSSRNRVASFRCSIVGLPRYILGLAGGKQLPLI